MLIRALAATRHVEILSRPQIRTLDNQLAEIQVAAEVPRISGFTQNANTGVITPLVEQTPTGITLSVTPRITPDDTIFLEVVAEKSQLANEGIVLVTDPTTGQPIESPIIDIKSARTTIAVANNQTVVLGGMITKEDVSETRKIPWLGDIPILGLAFRYDMVSTDRKELLIFLTPRIIHTDEENEMIKQIEAERIHFIQEAAEDIHGPIFAIPADGPGPSGPAWPSTPQPAPPVDGSPAAPDLLTPPTDSPTPPQGLDTSEPRADGEAVLRPVDRGRLQKLEAARLQTINAEDTSHVGRTTKKRRPSSLTPLRFLKGKKEQRGR
ncbi:MAG TPA: type II and III secretion system protein [Planctomycetaceae bacterium]|nr:type II and III secretion system protein [Planctomycetaceae bacterium]